MVAGEALEFLADELPEAATECDAAHGVDAEVSVVEEHEELLHAPQRSRCLLAPQREAHEHVQADHVGSFQVFLRYLKNKISHPEMPSMEKSP